MTHPTTEDALAEALRDAVETLEAMDLHTDNGLYDRIRPVLEQYDAAKASSGDVGEFDEVVFRGVLAKECNSRTMHYASAAIEHPEHYGKWDWIEAAVISAKQYFNLTRQSRPAVDVDLRSMIAKQFWDFSGGYRLGGEWDGVASENLMAKVQAHNFADAVIERLPRPAMTEARCRELLDEHISLAIAQWTMGLPITISLVERQALHEAIIEALDHLAMSRIAAEASGGVTVTDALIKQGASALMVAGHVTAMSHDDIPDVAYEMAEIVLTAALNPTGGKNEQP